MSEEKNKLLVFGYGLGLIAAVFAAGSCMKHGFRPITVVLCLCSIIFAGVTFLDWAALRPSYHAWMKITRLIGGVVTTVVLSVVFFLIFTPIGLLIRLMGSDHLQRNFSKKGVSYWKKRNQTEFRKQRYHQQF